MLGPRAKTEPAGPGRPAAPLLGGRRASTPGTARPPRPPRWPPWPSPGSGRRPPELAGAVDWLLAHRAGDRLAAAQGQGAGPGRPGGLLRPGPGRRGPLPPGRHRQRRRGLPGRRRRPGRGQGDPSCPRKALKAGDTNRVRFDIEGRGHVRLRRHPDRLHPRLRPRPGPGQPAVRHRPPRLPGRPTPSSTASPCRPASAWRSTPHDFENTVTQVAARRPGPRPDRRLPRRARPASRPGSATSWSSRSTCRPARP